MDYLGDEDSKAYAAVSEAAPYGNDVTTKQIECIGHVQIRMGKRLRELKKNKNKKLHDENALGSKNR